MLLWVLSFQAEQVANINISAGNVSAAQLQCLRSSGYIKVMIELECYQYLNPYVKDVVQNAKLAGLEVEYYIQPNILLDGYSTVQFILNQMIEHGLIGNKSSGDQTRLFLRILDDQRFNVYCGDNIWFVKTFIDGATDILGFQRVGILTDQESWKAIVSNWNSEKYHPLWWNKVDNVPNFDNFVSFADWDEPQLKLYAEQTMCGVGIEVSVE